MTASISGFHISTKQGFTLIELLVVIAIIAILAVVVVLTLNPAQLLAEGRDSQRVSDMATLTSALNLYVTDQSGGSSFSLGSSSVVYVSLPDPAATSTAGTNCASLGLPTLPSAYTYHCAASSTFRNANGQGWIPANFQSISAGSPFSNLPVDPTNNSSSRLYYTYTTNGTQFEVTAAMESSKYQLGGSNDQISGDGASLATVYAKGSNLALEPLDYGDPTLVGYWPLNEGSGNLAYDESGSGAYGTWNGTQAGSSTYYGTGMNGGWAGYFNGSNDNITVPTSTSLNTYSNGYSVSIWMYFNSPAATTEEFLVNRVIDIVTLSGSTSTEFRFQVPVSQMVYTASAGLWYLPGIWYDVVVTYNSASSQLSIYVNGTLAYQATRSAGTGVPTALVIDPSGAFTGLIQGVRVYNRALTAAQVAALFSGGK